MRIAKIRESMAEGPVAVPSAKSGQMTRSTVQDFRRPRRMVGSPECNHFTTDTHEDLHFTGRGWLRYCGNHYPDKLSRLYFAFGSIPFVNSPLPSPNDRQRS